MAHARVTVKQAAAASAQHVLEPVKEYLNTELSAFTKSVTEIDDKKLAKLKELIEKINDAEYGTVLSAEDARAILSYAGEHRGLAIGPAAPRSMQELAKLGLVAMLQRIIVVAPPGRSPSPEVAARAVVPEVQKVLPPAINSEGKIDWVALHETRVFAAESLKTKMESAAATPVAGGAGKR